jgi:hypothetical protein
MANLQPRYAAIPDVPAGGLTNWQAQTLSAIKENVELLTGTRGEKDGASKAVLKAQVTVANPPIQTMQRVTATGSGFTISGVKVAGLDDYNRLVVDVQQLANDVASLRNTVNNLISQLKG